METRDRARRYLVTVGSYPEDGLDVHLAVLGWNARLEAWVHGMAICGESVRQGELDTGATVTCPTCAKDRARFEQILANDPGDMLRTYTAILKQLPRTAAAELVAALARDPQIPSKAAIKQAAVLTSAAHALGWTSGPATKPTKEP